LANIHRSDTGLAAPPPPACRRSTTALLPTPSSG